MKHANQCRSPACELGGHLTSGVNYGSFVPNGNWNDNQVNFNENNPDNQNENARFRFAVMVSMSDGSHPSSQHSADLLQFALGFFVLSFRPELRGNGVGRSGEIWRL
ncbi:MAG: hypothetical protein AB7J46_01045 [Candidatus Altimarinota bacterium]